jgi:hypothetical protein
MKPGDTVYFVNFEKTGILKGTILELEQHYDGEPGALINWLDEVCPNHEVEMVMRLKDLSLEPSCFDLPLLEPARY